jgi:DNA-binding NarL/FixJ family response regulator
MNKTQIYIVDDHQIVIDGISSYLLGNEEFEITGSASSANELFMLLQKKQPDILILDCKLPGLQGTHIAKIVSDKYPKIKIIFLSSNTDRESLDKAIESGGLGYLSKDVTEEEFLLALSKINKGENYYSTGIQQAVFNSFTDNIKTETKNHDSPLSNREIEVIRLFVDGLSYKEIADRLSISSRTVETHKKHILEKLDLKTTVDLVKYAIRNGIITL